MRVNNDYKGTAFGDPARSLTAERIKDSKLQIANTNQSKAETTQLKSVENSNRQASAADRAKTTTAASKATEAQAQSAKSYPVDYKGTAFGDPAVTGKMIGGNLDIYM